MLAVVTCSTESVKKILVVISGPNVDTSVIDVIVVGLDVGSSVITSGSSVVGAKVEYNSVAGTSVVEANVGVVVTRQLASAG